MSTVFYPLLVDERVRKLLSLEKQILFLVSSAEGVDVKRLVEVYEARGVAHQLVRNSLSRLKKDGYIRTLERSMYAITDQGMDFITTINRKPRLFGQVWDGSWHTVMFEVPESDRKKRDAYRSDLLQLGFGPLFKSVYISPWDYSEEALRLATYHGIQARVRINRGTFVHNGPNAETVTALWPLEELNRTYKEKQEWLHSRFQPSLAAAREQAEDGGLSLFVHFLELGELMAELGLSDPMLPNELLPHDWAGKACFGAMQRTLQEIANAIPADSAYRPFVSRQLGE